MILSRIAKIAWASTKKEKAEIIDEIIDDGYKELIDLIFDKDIRFYVAVNNISGSALIDYELANKTPKELDDQLLEMLKTFAKGELRGNEALILCDRFEQYLNSDEIEMFRNILENKTRLGIGATDINKLCKNTNIKQFKVMFAKPLEKAKIYKNKVYIAQPKIDGNRCVGIKEKGKPVEFFSRTGKKIHTLKLIEDIINENNKTMACVYDGEIENGSLEETGSIRRLEGDAENPIYTLFGIYDYDQWMNENHTHKYEYVYGFTQIELFSWKNNDRVRLIPGVTLFGDDKFDEILEEINNENLENGYEGTVLKTLDHVYQPSTGSKRSNDWIKIKPWLDSNSIIEEIIEGEGLFSGTCGGFWVSWNGEKFKVGTGKLTEDHRKSIWANQDYYYGRTLEFKYQRLTKYGIPFHAHAIKIRDIGDE